MVYTYEVFVDMKEYESPNSSHARLRSVRYEIDADTKRTLDAIARHCATTDFPNVSEYDIRITRRL